MYLGYTLADIEEIAESADNGEDISYEQMDLLESIQDAIHAIDEVLKEEDEELKNGDKKRIREFYEDHPTKDILRMEELKKQLEFDWISIINAMTELFSSDYKDTRMKVFLEMLAARAIAKHATVYVWTKHCHLMYNEDGEIKFDIITFGSDLIFKFGDSEIICVNKKYFDKIKNGADLPSGTKTADYLAEIIRVAITEEEEK